MDPNLETPLQRTIRQILPHATRHEWNQVEALIASEVQAALEEVPEPGSGDILPGPEFSFPDDLVRPEGPKGGEG